MQATDIICSYKTAAVDIGKVNDIYGAGQRPVICFYSTRYMKRIIFIPYQNFHPPGTMKNTITLGICLR